MSSTATFSRIDMRLPMLGVVLSVLTLLAIQAGLSGLHSVDDPLADWRIHVQIGLSVITYLLAVFYVRRVGVGNLWVIVGVGLALRLILSVSHPMLSSDMYRYVWDGRVALAGINPYLYVPADEALRFLRDDFIFTNMNRPDYAHTIYPPFAQMFFALVGLISPTLTAMRLAIVALDGVSIWALIRLLDLAGRDRALVLIYAWNPLVFWEFGNNAHIDALAVCLILLSLLVMFSRAKNWAGPVFGGAVLTKFLPLVIAPALWPRGGWRAATGSALLIAILYTVYAIWGHAGWQVLGFLGEYRHEEQLDSGSGYWIPAVLGQMVSLPHGAGTAFGALAAGLLGVLGAWIAFVRRPMELPDVALACVWLVMALLLLLTPHYAWYYAWLSAFAVLAPVWPAIWLSSAAMLLYEPGLPPHVVLPSVLFVSTLALVWFDRRAVLSTQGNS